MAKSLSVVSTDPGTGKTTPQHVSLLHINHDRDLVHVKVAIYTPASTTAKVKIGVGQGAGTVRNTRYLTIETAPATAKPRANPGCSGGNVSAHARSNTT